jgi:hypothetical protein
MKTLSPQKEKENAATQKQKISTTNKTNKHPIESV